MTIVAPKYWFILSFSSNKTVAVIIVTTGSPYNSKAVFDCPILAIANSCKKNAIA